MNENWRILSQTSLETGLPCSHCGEKVKAGQEIASNKKPDGSREVLHLREDQCGRGD